MFAIRIDLLTGSYSASAFDDRQRPEWPPHPGRLLSALVHQWAAAGKDEAERSALLWLETLDPPQIACSHTRETAVRDVVTHYVPVNDPSGIEFLPDERGKQERTFPVATPESGEVFFCWPAAEPPQPIRDSLGNMLDRVSRLGHSASMVSCSLVTNVPSPTFVARSDGDLPVRVPTPGLLAALEASFASHQGDEPRVLPNWVVRYGPPGEQTSRGLYGEMLILRISERDHDPRKAAKNWDRLPLVATQSWCRALRGALASNAERHDDFINGHEPGSSAPRQSPHPCFVPLADVGHGHADGAVHGFAIVLPRSTTAEERLAIEEGLDRWSASSKGMLLYTKGGRQVSLERVPHDEHRRTLGARRWDRPSQTWSTVTPIVLGRFPDKLNSKDPKAHAKGLRDTERLITALLADQGLPAPEAVTLSIDAPLVAGSAATRSFPPYRRGRNGPALAKIHCTLRFAKPVAGPLVLGAGRHLGFGLMTAEAAL